MMITPQAASYLNHFRLDQLPFTLTPNTQFYCSLSSHQATLNVLLVGLFNKEGFLKVTGEVGTGKTLLCRTLLRHLKDYFYTTYILNPNLSPEGLFRALASELRIDFCVQTSQQHLQEKIIDRLVELYEKNQPVVLIIDEAQTMPIKTMEAVRLLTNLETEATKLLQIVLFGQPELDIILERKDMRQLKQRVTFSHRLAPVPHAELNTYLNHRLGMAGYRYGELFTKQARKSLYRASEGIPRVINILCHKALLSAYGKNKPCVDMKAMRHAVKDSRDLIPAPSTTKRYLIIAIAICTVSILTLIALICHHTITTGHL